MFEGLHKKLNAVVYCTCNRFVPEEERHDSALKRNREALATELKLWDGYLHKVPPSLWLTIFPTVATLFRFGLSAELYPHLGEYYALLKERPSVKASRPPHWLENPEEQDALNNIGDSLQSYLPRNVFVSIKILWFNR